MKLLSRLILLLIVPSALSAQSFEWETSQLCSLCKPQIAWFADSANGHIYTAQNYYSYPIQDHRTNDGGRTWRLASDSAYAYHYSELDNYQFYLSAASIYWRVKNDLLHSEDSGITWRRTHMFPVPSYLRMFSLDSGLGIIEEEDNQGETVVRLRRSTDGGAYWYGETGVPYANPYEVRDAVFLSDSVFVFLHSNGFESEIVRSSDQGASWSSSLKIAANDSIVAWRLTVVEGTELILLESYFNSSIMVSSDRGVSWINIPASSEGYTYRTRISALGDGRLIFWSATGTVFGNPTGNLLNPNFENAFAYSLLVSVDTGRTWQYVALPGLPEGAQLFDIVPVGDRMNVIAYKDSVTYISTTTIGDPLQIRATPFPGMKEVSVFPNPLRGRNTLRVISPFEECDAISLVNSLGYVVRWERINGSKNKEMEIDLQGLARGTYLLRLEKEGQSLRSSRVIIE